MDTRFFINLFFISIISLFTHEVMGQNIRLDSLTSLVSTLTESSGLMYLDGKVITHNDSGGEAALYELDTLSGSITRKVVIGNVSNTDWEDICQDDTHMYIGDFGNNNGTRQDLKVYKILISDFQRLDTVMAESISFSYADQTTFNSNQFQTNFDAEALISFGDSLYIFSKNWGNSRTNVYPLSKTSGTYVISKVDSIDSQGLVTGATVNQQSGELWICGYTFSDAFVIQVKHWTGSTFSIGEISRYLLEINGSFQVEAITEGPENTYYVSAEGNASVPAVLYSIYLDESNGILSYDSQSLKVFPIPASNILKVESLYGTEISLFTLDGRRGITTSSKEIDISALTPGLYVLTIFVPDKNQMDIRKIWIGR